MTGKIASFIDRGIYQLPISAPSDGKNHEKSNHFSDWYMQCLRDDPDRKQAIVRRNPEGALKVINAFEDRELAEMFILAHDYPLSSYANTVRLLRQEFGVDLVDSHLATVLPTESTASATTEQWPAFEFDYGGRGELQPAERDRVSVQVENGGVTIGPNVRGEELVFPGDGDPKGIKYRRKPR